MIERRIYDTSTLLGVMREIEPPSNYWMNLCFPQTVNFTDEYVDLARIEGQRKVAPLVVPTAQGRPIYSRSERTARFKPAYLKPKDPISDARMIKRQAGMGELLATRPMTPAERYNAIVADVQLEHRDAIMRRWEWMAAQAVQFSKVLLEDDGYPTALVDFGRDAAHDIVLGAGSRWGDAGVRLMSQIESWQHMIRRASFGGPTNRLTVGSQAWDALKADQEIRDLLNVNFRSNANVNLNMGIREGLDVEYVGRLSNSLEVYVYSDYYTDTNGNVVPFMDPRDVVLTGPNIQGIKCFGAILDKKAGFQAVPMFPKMWDSEDPSATLIMTQSAPLMVPMNPNNSLRARVVA